MQLVLKRKQFDMYSGGLTKLTGGKPCKIVNTGFDLYGDGNGSSESAKTFRKMLSRSGGLTPTPLSMGPKPVTLGGSSVLKSTWWRTNRPTNSNIAGLYTEKK